MRKTIIIITVCALILSIIVPALTIFLTPTSTDVTTVSGE